MKALGNKTEIYMSNDTSLSVEAAHVPATRLRTVWLVFFGCAALNSLSYIYAKVGFHIFGYMGSHPGAVTEYVGESSAGTFIIVFLIVVFILVGSIFKKNRTPAFRRNTIIYTSVIVTLIMNGAMYLDRQAEEIRAETDKWRSTQLEMDNVLVVHSKESSAQFVDLVIDIETMELLEESLQESHAIREAKMLENAGFSSGAARVITNSTVGTVNHFRVPLGLATVWSKSLSSEGEVRSKYVHVAGVIGNTLHRVVCTQLNGDNMMLLVNKKCQAKLDEVFFRKI